MSYQFFEREERKIYERLSSFERWKLGQKLSGYPELEGKATGY